MIARTTDRQCSQRVVTFPCATYCPRGRGRLGERREPRRYCARRAVASFDFVI
jgi:hypothetical protein